MKSARAGFTLVELLVVISIIATLAAVILASLVGARTKGTIAASQTFDRNLYGAYNGDLSASWDFDGDSGTTVKDQSGNGNDLAVSSGALVTTPNPFPSGKVLKIDNTNAITATAANASLAHPPATLGDTSQPFSVSFWLYLTGVDYFEIMSNYSTIVSAGMWRIAPKSQGTLNFDIRSSTNQVKTFTGPVVVPSVWYQVVVVCGSPTNASFGLYVNGQQSGSYLSFTSGVCAYNLATAVRMTGQNIAASSLPPFYLDNVRIYGKALTLAEIQDSYYAGLDKHRDLARLSR